MYLADGNSSKKLLSGGRESKAPVSVALRVSLAGLFLVMGVVTCSQKEESKSSDNSAPASESVTQETPTSTKTKVTPPPTDGEITVGELKSALDNNEDIYLLDVRSEAEYQAEHVAGVDLVIPHPEIVAQADKLPTDKDRYFYVICRSGRRSAIAIKALKELGYTRLYNVVGGMLAWIEAKYPVSGSQ